MNPAAPRRTARFSLMFLNLLLGAEVIERQLTGERLPVLLEHEVDALADVLRDGHTGPLVQELEPLVLLGRDVDGRRDLFRAMAATGEPM